MNVEEHRPPKKLINVPKNIKILLIGSNPLKPYGPNYKHDLPKLGKVFLFQFTRFTGKKSQVGRRRGRRRGRCGSLRVASPDADRLGLCWRIGCNLHFHVEPW